MRADSNQPHYAPSSVGGLMDPDFLRSARYDADGRQPVYADERPGLWLRLQQAVQSMLAVMRPH